MPKPDDIPLPPAWTHADTMAYLDENPTPVDFTWFHKNKDAHGRPILAVVKPKYTLSGGFGKWLHDTPYFPGLFELIHDLLFHSGATLPDIDTLVAHLDRIKAERTGQGELL